MHPPNPLEPLTMSDASWIVAKPEPRGATARLVAYVRSHPILFLILLTPGIPEYLSASSHFTLIGISPLLFLISIGLFFALMAANVALYGSGVLLIREAMIRWKKGWATVFLLGVAYGILEEGVDLWTLFYSKAGPVGNLGYYGHWLGVNWVWTMGLLIFHSVYSIGLPIFLFGLAIPEMKSKNLLSSRGLKKVFLTLIIDSICLFALVSNSYSPYNPGGGLILLSLLTITVLIIAARKLPGNFLTPRQGLPKWGPHKFALAGALLFPSTLLVGGFAAGANIPPIIPFVLDLVLALLILTRAFNSMGSTNNQEQRVAFSIGLILPIAAFGLVASIGLVNPFIVVADILFVLFSRRLWRKWHYWTLHQPAMQKPWPGFGGPSSPILP